MKIDTYIPSGIPSGANDPIRRTDAVATSADSRRLDRTVAGPADSVEVSSLASAALAREQRIEQLAVRVAEGRYQPDSRAVARALTAELLGE